ncbi:Protein of unknown function [Daejeonella rubra]|uniref:Uncharacterized protein n=2 Tax=Daejeonella rubra TaxID=990371 RepID=A0A1G9UMQ1_9SPHI|nr:Protein of unknown function [Daejeonella rubra]
MKELKNIRRETILLLSMIKILHLVDDEFQSQNAAKCDLLIHIGIETFQYAIIDKVRDELKALVEYELPEISNQGDLIEAIRSLSECSKEFKYPFNTIKISFDSYQYTFIPDELYQSGNDQEYAKFLKTSQNTNILCNPIPAAKLKNIVGINSDLHLALNSIFHHPKIYGQASTYIQGIKKNYKQNTEPSLFIDIHKKHIQIAYFKQSELSFYNMFDCINADELNYFVLNIIESLQLDIEQTSVILSGNVIKDDEYYQRIEKYFKDIKFADCSTIVNHPEMFIGVFSHTFFSLLTLDQCE